MCVGLGGVGSLAEEDRVGEAARPADQGALGGPWGDAAGTGSLLLTAGWAAGQIEGG